MWQDYVLTAVQAVFAFSLIPTIRDKTQKPALKTAVVTGAGMVALTAVYMSKDWWYGASVAGVVAAQWFVLGWQRHRLDMARAGRTIPFGKLLSQLWN